MIVSLQGGSAVALLTLLAGCYPHPHDYVLTQEFTGVLLEDGRPMPGVSVTVSHTRGDSGDYCENPEVGGVTSESGHFRVTTRVQRQLFASLMNPPKLISQTMSVCLQAASKVKLGAWVNSPTDRQVSYSAACEWNSRGVEFKQNLILNPNQFGICARADRPHTR